MPQHAPHTHVVMEQARPGGSPRTAGVRYNPAPDPRPAGCGHWSKDPHLRGSAPWRQNEAAGAGTLTKQCLCDPWASASPIQDQSRCFRTRILVEEGVSFFLSASIRQMNLRADLTENTSIISAPSCPTSRLHYAALRGPHQ